PSQPLGPQLTYTTAGREQTRTQVGKSACSETCTRSGLPARLVMQPIARIAIPVSVGAAVPPAKGAVSPVTPVVAYRPAVAHGGPGDHQGHAKADPDDEERGDSPRHQLEAGHWPGSRSRARTPWKSRTPSLRSGAPGRSE